MIIFIEDASFTETSDLQGPLLLISLIEIIMLKFKNLHDTSLKNDKSSKK